MSKIHRWGMIAAFIVILVSSYFAVKTVFIEDKSVIVPKLTGLQLVDAVDALQKEGLLAKIDKVDSPLRADTVVSQNIAEGEKVAKGKVLVLRVSKGGSLVPLPDVRGMKFEEAVTRLNEAGFKVSTVTRVTDKFKPAGTVIAQNPASPQHISASSMVSLLVSSGPTEGSSFITVPDLSGQHIGLVRDILEQSGLLVGRVTESPSQSPEGTVLSTSPNRGARVQSGTQVNMVVAREPLIGEMDPEKPDQPRTEPVRTVVIQNQPASAAPSSTPPAAPATPAATPAQPSVKPAAPEVKPTAPAQPAEAKKTAKVRYQVPPLTKPMALKIEMTDSDGKKSLRDSQTSGNEYISLNVPYTKEATITIFLGGEFVWQERFK